MGGSSDVGWVVENYTRGGSNRRVGGGWTRVGGMTGMKHFKLRTTPSHLEILFKTISVNRILRD